MNSVSEKIDERILRLLGLEYTFDLDYDTYLILIREAIVSGANKLPQEELALLANERRRIRGKKGRFKPKKQKINANRIATTKFLKPAVQPISTPLLPAQIGESSSQIQIANFSSLQEPLESIKKVLLDFLGFKKNENQDERKQYEKENRKKRESGLEGLKKGLGAVSDVVKKFVSPFQNIIDRIWRFIFFTLLGRAFTQLVDWFRDSKNKKKIDVLNRFLKDWWPALLAAATLFLTPFGGFVRSVLSIVVGFTGRLVSQIPAIAGAIKNLSSVLLNPWIAIPTSAAGLALAANEVTGQRKAASLQASQKAKAQREEGIYLRGTDTLQDRTSSVGDMGPVTPYRMLQGAARGGSVIDGYGGIDSNTGSRISGFGPDTQLIAAQPGEIVLNKRTVDAVGADTFLGLNRYYGGAGANQPKFGRLYNSGGVVGGTNLIRPQAKTIIDRLIAGGMTPTAAAGIVSNIGVETGYTYNPNTHQRGDGPGRGLVQWEKGGRFDTDRINLKSFAKSKGKPWNDLNTQIDYILHEMNVHPEYKSVKSAMNSAKNISEATKIFLERYEKAGVPHIEDRLKVAQQLMNAGYIKPNKPNKPKVQPSIMDMVSRTMGTISGGLLGGTLRKKGGGLIKESSGQDIKGATADRQLIAAQPGEYVLPVNTVNRVGTSLIDKLVAMTDSDSTAAKLGYRTKNIPQIKPLSRKGSNNTITLPPITQSTGSGRVKTVGGSRVPIFSTSSSSGSDVRAMNASVYGIVG